MFAGIICFLLVAMQSLLKPKKNEFWKFTSGLLKDSREDIKQNIASLHFLPVIHDLVKVTCCNVLWYSTYSKITYNLCYDTLFIVR